MTLRKQMEDLVAAGPLPREDSATPDDLEGRESLLGQIVAPISDEEAKALLSVFGPDGCFGLAWTVLHLIETAPSALTADYSQFSENEWV
ncbi:hypothetical protein EDD29_5926 [Actinocorallia herbida]|uniref:Uncharacterized protein n=1 Tax=Actinocorallia herbida TaxID=58109 RepID=A0A3N1D3Z8_9ACTN|nr:hypothetical protein EDD29_5926 [Actinocorallia herbida]